MNIIDQLGKGRKRWLFAAVDVIFPLLVVLAVDLIAIPFSELGAFIADRWYITLIQIAIYPIAFFLFRLYRVSWVYCSAWECVYLIAVCGGCTVLGVLVNFIRFGWDGVFKLSLASGFIIFAGLIGSRLLLTVLFRLLKEKQKEQIRRPKRTLVIGAGELAVILLRDNSYNDRVNYDIVGLIDDDPAKLHQKVHGATVIGGRDTVMGAAERFSYSVQLWITARPG